MREKIISSWDWGIYVQAQSSVFLVFEKKEEFWRLMLVPSGGRLKRQLLGMAVAL